MKPFESFDYSAFSPLQRQMGLNCDRARDGEWTLDGHKIVVDHLACVTCEHILGEDPLFIFA